MSDLGKVDEPRIGEIAMQYVVIWAAIATASLILAGFLAGWKNRDVSFWMAWGFIVPPSVLVLALLPKRGGARPRRRTLDEEDAAEA
jgi:hypothetical protein